MTAAAELGKGELAWVVLGQAEVLCERRACYLGRRCMSSLCLTVEGLRKIVGKGNCGALHICILAPRQGSVDVLAGMRTELFNRIGRAIAAWEIAPLHASIFGSTARGDGDTESDIDLFIVRPSSVQQEDARWQAQLDDVARQIQRWTGNHAGVAEASEEELGRLRTEEPPIVSELRSDAIVLSGPEIQALLEGS